jgi:RecA-family ATPase
MFIEPIPPNQGLHGCRGKARALSAITKERLRAGMKSIYLRRTPGLYTDGGAVHFVGALDSTLERYLSVRSSKARYPDEEYLRQFEGVSEFSKLQPEKRQTICREIDALLEELGISDSDDPELDDILCEEVCLTEERVKARNKRIDQVIEEANQRFLARTNGVNAQAPSQDNDAGQDDAKAGASEGAQAKSAPLIKATPYSWPDPQSIPLRDWLYGRHFIRGFVSATVAPGGIGKSSLLFAEALSMVSGRALLHGIEPVAPLNVWIWNGEDPLVELYRRVAASAKHYGIRQQDCSGCLLIDSGREMKIIVAKTQKGETIIYRPVLNAIEQTIEKHKIDVLVIDPFVSSHRVSENDNNAIDEIAREWADIADKTGCAIELVHHVRKVGDIEVTVEMARGASSLISAARCARVLNPMSTKESNDAGVENRRVFFRVNDGKSNMSPASDKATWFRMQSVNLENNGRYLEGDSIGVVTEWKWPDPLEDVTAKDLQAVLQVVGAGRWRESQQAKDWVGRAVADALGLDVEDERSKAKIKGLLKIWIKNGALAVVDGKDEKRMDRKFIEVGSVSDG